MPYTRDRRLRSAARTEGQTAPAARAGAAGSTSEARTPQRATPDVSPVAFSSAVRRVLRACRVRRSISASHRLGQSFLISVRGRRSLGGDAERAGGADVNLDAALEQFFEQIKFLPARIDLARFAALVLQTTGDAQRTA